MSPEQKSEYVETKKYESEARLAERHDKIRMARANCKASGLIWWIDGFSHSEVSRMDRDPDWFPRHAHVHDFACMTASEVRRALRYYGF